MAMVLDWCMRGCWHRSVLVVVSSKTVVMVRMAMPREEPWFEVSDRWVGRESHWDMRRQESSLMGGFHVEGLERPWLSMIMIMIL